MRTTGAGFTSNRDSLRCGVVVSFDVVDGSVPARHGVDLCRGQSRAQPIITATVAVLPFATNGPAAVVGDLNPDVAFAPMVKNMKCRSSRQRRHARRSNRCLSSPSPLSRQRQCVGVNEHARGFPVHSPSKNEAQNHRGELWIKPFWFANRGVDARLVHYNRSKIPTLMFEQYRNYGISSRCSIFASMERAEVLSMSSLNKREAQARQFIR